MTLGSIKSIVVAVFSLCIVFFSNTCLAQEGQPKAGTEKKEKFDANEIIFGHVLDAHEFHFLSYIGSDGEKHHVNIPLPVILYSPQKGWSVFMSSAFHHGEHEVEGYKMDGGKVVAVDPGVKVYDISLTRTVVQLILVLTIFVVVMIQVAAKYKSGAGVTKAPTGFQNLIEPVITFIRDDVGKTNLGTRYEKYMPYLLTVFFFILINNLFGLIPGSANVTGNIAVTTVLGIIAFFVITLSTNSHFWTHIFNPPGVPAFVKPILIPVEFLGIFIKPFALIIRLFANMVAGHIIIICLISLIFIFGELSPAIGWGASPVSVAFTVFIYLIEVLVAFLQAYIFTSLTAVFIGLAIEETHHEGSHDEGYDDAVIV